MGPLAPLDLQAIALRATTGDAEAISTLYLQLLDADRESANRTAESIACLDDVFVRQVFDWMRATEGLQDIMAWLLLVRARSGLPFDWSLSWIEAMGRDPGQVPVPVRYALLRWLVEFAAEGVGPTDVLQQAVRCDDDAVALRAAELLMGSPFDHRSILERLRRVRGVSVGRSALLRYRLGDPDAVELLVGLVATDSPWSLEAIRYLRVNTSVPPRLRALLQRGDPGEAEVRLAGWMAAYGESSGLEMLRKWSHARTLRIMLCARAELLVFGTDAERRAIVMWAQSQQQHMVERLLDAVEVLDDHAAAFLQQMVTNGQLGRAGGHVAKVVERALRYPCGPAASDAG
jgi:hypothetical protein